MQHLKNRGEFLLGEHAQLKVEVRAFFGLTHHPVLTNQYENTQADALRGHHKCQDAEGKRIKRSQTGNQFEIHGSPDSNQNNL